MSTPSLLKQSTVERQSAPGKKPVISVFPSAIEPNMTARWEMDLSPGTQTSPRSGTDLYLMVLITDTSPAEKAAAYRFFPA
jgi:hypothetical protein